MCISQYARVMRASRVCVNLSPVPCAHVPFGHMVLGTCSSHDDLYQIGATYTFRYSVGLVQVLKWHFFGRLKHV